MLVVQRPQAENHWIKRTSFYIRKAQHHPSPTTLSSKNSIILEKWSLFCSNYSLLNVWVITVSSEPRIRADHTLGIQLKRNQWDKITYFELFVYSETIHIHGRLVLIMDYINCYVTKIPPNRLSHLELAGQLCSTTSFKNPSVFPFCHSTTFFLLSRS